MYVCVCVCITIYIQTQLGSLFVVCMYMVSELTTLQWATSKGAHPWERLILLPAVIVASGVELGKIPPFRVNMSYVIVIVLVLSAAISRTDCFICFTVDLLVFCLLQFLPSCHRYRSCVVDVPIGTGFPSTCWSLCCIQLCVSVMVSIAIHFSLIS